MRILVLSDVPPGAVGGAEVQAMHLARRWAAAGHEVTVAGHANRPGGEGRLEIVRIPTLRANRLLRGASYLVATLWLIHRHRREFDVIYCRFLKEHALVASLAKLLFRLPQPLLACPESSSIHGEVHHLSGSPLRPVLTRVLKSGLAAVNAISGRIERELLTLDLGVPVTRIPNGVVIPPPAAKPEPASPALKVLFVGRLVPVKGLDVLVDAVGRASARGCAVHLRIVGGGPLRAALEAQVRARQLQTCVEFAGAVAPDRVTGEFLDADVFVLPSHHEGLPVALLEALAHGLPAIATRVSGSEDLVGDDVGWLVPPGDAGALAAALEAAVETGRSRLQAMGERARETVARDYDIDVVSQRYLQLFDELVGASRRTAR